MEERKRMPQHPGGIMKRQYMEPLCLSVSGLAKVLGVSRKTVSKIVNERGAVTTDMALRLSQAFNTTPQFWLNMQQNHDLWLAAHKSKEWKAVEPVAA